MRTCIVTGPIPGSTLTVEASYPDSHALADPSGALRIVKMDESAPGCDTCGDEYKDVAIYASGTWTGVRYEEKEEGA